MDRHDEILSVKRLGEEIGYGNLMSIASALWAVNLEEKHGITTGNFIPTMIFDIKDGEKERYAIELKHNKEEIRNQL